MSDAFTNGSPVHDIRCVVAVAAMATTLAVLAIVGMFLLRENNNPGAVSSHDSTRAVALLDEANDRGGEVESSLSAVRP